jgi:stage V sporulation protein R
MARTLKDNGLSMEALGQDLGLDYYPLHFEEVPESFMMEIAVYGLPVRMPHWSFGVRYIYQLVQHRMGNSRLYEVVYPGNPGRAYLTKGNSLAENTLVVAHVLGHADFSKNNTLFKRSQEEIGYRIVEQAAAHAQRIASAIEEHGEERVESVLDAALALEAHVDTFKGMRRNIGAKPADTLAKLNDPFRDRYRDLPGERPPESNDEVEQTDADILFSSEQDLLWFIANHAPDLEGWERDIFLAVREESFYFYPVFACQIMNEGWACHWHAKLLCEADFLSDGDYLDAIKAHSDVVRPHATGSNVSLATNHYHLGFRIWERIIEEQGIDRAFEIRAEDDDFSFIRSYLTEDLAAELDLFQYVARTDGTVEVIDNGIAELRESILASRFNFGAPVVLADRIDVDGTLHLIHDHKTDGRGLDLQRTEKVLEYVQRVWHRKVTMDTVDAKGAPRTMTIAA